MSKGNEKPVFKITSGSVTGSVFINEDKESGNKWFSVNVQKFYNEGTQKKPSYAYTNNYNQIDLPNLRLVSEKCFEYTTQNRANSDEE